MVGTMPSTALLLIKDRYVLGNFNTYSEIAYYLGVNVSDDGVVTFMGKECLPLYVMKKNEYTIGSGWDNKHDIIVDWAKYHMCKSLPSGYGICRYLT